MDRARRNSTDDARPGTSAPVLVLDDDPGICQTISAVLSRAGFDVVCFNHPRPLLKWIVASDPGCVLIDVVLPGVSGLDVLRELRSRNCRAPVLMISGKANIATAVAAIKQGAIDFIEKPFRGCDLVSRVNAALQSVSGKAGRAMFHFPGRPPLTLREQDVLAELIGGQSTKEIAAQLNLHAYHRELSGQDHPQDRRQKSRRPRSPCDRGAQGLSFGRRHAGHKFPANEHLTFVGYAARHCATFRWLPILPALYDC